MSGDKNVHVPYTLQNCEKESKAGEPLNINEIAEAVESTRLVGEGGDGASLIN